MQTNKELLNKLNDMLEYGIKNSLKNHGKNICEKELLRIRGTLNLVSNKARSSQTNRGFYKNEEIIELKKTIQNVLKKIDSEGHSLENEANGVQNYSLNLNQRMEKHAYKIELSKVLNAMLATINEYKPELSEF